jgi:hypothetical protein
MVLPEGMIRLGFGMSAAIAAHRALVNARIAGTYGSYPHRSICYVLNGFRDSVPF